MMLSFIIMEVVDQRVGRLERGRGVSGRVVKVVKWVCWLGQVDGVNGEGKGREGRNARVDGYNLRSTQRIEDRLRFLPHTLSSTRLCLLKRINGSVFSGFEGPGVHSPDWGCCCCEIWRWGCGEGEDCEGLDTWDGYDVVIFWLGNCGCVVVIVVGRVGIGARVGA